MPQTTISATRFQPNLNGLGDAPYIRFWYTGQSFIAGDGVTPVTVGNGQDQGFYLDVVCSIVADRLLMPATDLWATTDGSPATSRFFGQLYSEEGAPSDMLFGANSGWQLPTIYGSVIAYDELATYNRAAYLLYPPPTYFTADQTIAEIRRLAGDFMYMAVGVNGIGSIDTAPADAALPVVIGTNSRRAPDFYNIIAYGASTSNTATQNATAITAAVTAATITGGGLYIPVGTFSTNSVTISVPLQFAPGASILSVATGQTITITKSLTADPSKHFDNATSGLGTVALTGNTVTTFVYPEWWGGGSGVAAATNAAALNAANAALVTIGAGVIRLASAGAVYDFDALLTLGSDSVSFTSISLEGVGGLVGSTLNWTGSTSGTAIYITNARAVNFQNVFLSNGVAIGTTVGVLLGGPGPTTATQTSGVIFYNSFVRGFKVNVQIGTTSLGVASEVQFINCGIDNNTLAGTGIKVTGFNSLVIKLSNSNISFMDVGLDVVTGGDTHIFGGGFGRSAIDIRNQGTSQMIVSGSRFELDPTEIAVQATNAAPMLILGNAFAANSTVPSVPVLQGLGQWTLQNNAFGTGSDTGWKTIEIATSQGGSLVMQNNRIFGTEPFYIDPGTSASNGLTYLLSGNQKSVGGFFDSRFPDEAGQVVWPDKISFSRAASGFVGTSYSPAQITGNTNNYSPLNPNTGLAINAPMYLRLTTDASRNLTGLVFLTAAADGQTVTIINAGAQDIVLKHQDAASTAANRFANTTGADITLTPNQQALLVYDAAASPSTATPLNRWRVSKMN